jgi:hypothetical protein
MALADLRQQLVDRDVIARAQKLLDDRLALRGRVQSAVLDIGTPALLELAGVTRPEIRALLRPHLFQLPRNCSSRQAISTG